MKQKKRELMMQELGKYCLDMSKLIFGGVILAGIMNLGVENIYLFGVGGVLVAFFAAIGFNFYANQDKCYGVYLFFNRYRCGWSADVHWGYVV